MKEHSAEVDMRLVVDGETYEDHMSIPVWSPGPDRLVVKPDDKMDYMLWILIDNCWESYEIEILEIKYRKVEG